MGSVALRGNPIRRALGAWVGAVHRVPWLVTIASILCAGGSLYYVAENVGMLTDTADIISPELPWRQDYIRYQRAFPDDVDTLVLVIDGVTPDVAEAASRRLAQRLTESELVVRVSRPGGGDFFERNGLLFLEPEALDALSERMARVQPFLGSLAGDPSLVALLTLLERALGSDEADAELGLTPFLAAMAATLEADRAGGYQPLSWRSLMQGDDDLGASSRRFVIVRPDLDWTELFPAEPMFEHIRSLARSLELSPEHGVRVRITGAVAMEHEELVSVMRGAELNGVLALVLVSIVLVLGLQSWRLVVSSLVTLLVGLSWTAAFATFAIGHLNLISVAFAVLYIGLGIAYAVHYCLRYRELVHQGNEPSAALCETASDIGGSLVVCALTTGIGFYAFVPTDFLGVSELGLISGTGMFISLFASVTVLPALLTLMPLRAAVVRTPHPRSVRHRFAGWPEAHRRTVIRTSMVLALASIACLPWVRFDENPINLRAADGEAVSTFRELLAVNSATAWPMIVLAGDQREAAALAATLESLPEVDTAIRLRDFVPDGQDQKLDRIDELGLLLGLDLERVATEPASHGLEQRRFALDALSERLRAVSVDNSRADLAAGARRLHAALEPLGEALRAGDQESWARMEQRLLAGLPPQLESLGAALGAEPVTETSLPDELRRAWIGSGGEHRVEVLAAKNLDEPDAMRAFVATVQDVAPQATGNPVVYLESGRVVVRAFQEAFALALVLIVIVLFVLLRRWRLVAFVTAPLALAGLLTVAAMVLMGVPFNFANVIALPLLLGVGVDNGIHMVHRILVAPPGGALLETSTARAVTVSALTTVASFGNLALSPHPGTASMGLVLSVGLAFALLTTLVLLPAMLATHGRSRAGIGP